MLHRPVQKRRKEESDTRLANRAGDHLGRRLNVHAERLQHVARAAPARRAPVAVLRDVRPGAGRHDGGARRNVERLSAGAPRAARVDDRKVADVDARGLLAHDKGGAGDFVGRRTLDGKGHEVGGDLGGGRPAFHDEAHRLARLLEREVLAAPQFLDERDHGFPVFERGLRSLSVGAGHTSTAAPAAASDTHIRGSRPARRG